MPLSFLTQDQQFIFADSKTHQIVNPSAAHAGRTYDVYIVITNSTALAQAKVQANVWHTGLGRRDVRLSTGLTQPEQVVVPGSAFGNPGHATMSFRFNPPSDGCCRLFVQLVPDGPTIIQDVRIGRPRCAPRGRVLNADKMLFYPLDTGSFRGLRNLAISLE